MAVSLGNIQGICVAFSMRLGLGAALGFGAKTKKQLKKLILHTPSPIDHADTRRTIYATSSLEVPPFPLALTAAEISVLLKPFYLYTGR